MTLNSTMLSQSQTFTFSAFGIGAWLAAALVLRTLGPLGIYDGGWQILVYALIIPGTVPLIWLAAWMAKAKPGQVFVGFALSSGVATVCDGMALAWFPSLYGATIAVHAGAGAMILWGIGVGIILAYTMDRTPAAQS